MINVASEFLPGGSSIVAYTSIGYVFKRSFGFGV
jgi:hypothetical protein